MNEVPISVNTAKNNNIETVHIESGEFNIASTRNTIWPQQSQGDCKTDKEYVSSSASARTDENVLQHIKIDEIHTFDLFSYLRKDDAETWSIGDNFPNEKIEEESRGWNERPEIPCTVDTNGLSYPESTSIFPDSEKDKKESIMYGAKKKVKIDSDQEEPGQSDENNRISKIKKREAARKSRLKKKIKDYNLTIEAEQLEKKNRVLKIKFEESEKLVTVMRANLMEMALNRC